MAYRYARIEIAGADDSSLQAPVFGPLKMFFDQTKDLQIYSQIHRVNATDTEFTVPISSSLTTVYFYAIFSDYPILVRRISGGTVQEQLRTNNVAAVNVSTPAPDQCVMLCTGTLLNNFLTLTPITGAAQTARVKVFAAGDPISAYI